MAAQITRRSFLTLAATGAAGALLAACQPAQTPQGGQQEPTTASAPPAAKQVEIRFEDESEVGPDGYKVFTDVLIPQFQDANPGVTVSFEPATGDWAQKITTQMAAGNAPDVMVAYGQSAHQWMESSQLLPLEDVFTSDELTDFHEAQLIEFRLDNHLYAMPKYVSCIVLAYNKDLFDEAGLEYADEDWTWDDMLIAAKALTKTDSGGKTTQWGYRVMQNYIQHWVWANGGEWMDKDAWGTKILIDQAKALEALRFNWDLQFTYKYAPMAQDVEGVGSFDTFQTGTLGLTECHSWQVTDYIKRNNFQYEYTLLPKAPTGDRVGHVFGNAYGVFKGTKQPEVAIDFVRFVTSPDAEREMCTSVLGLQPARKSVDVTWDNDSQGAKAGYNVKAFSDMAAIARLDPFFKNDAKVREIYNPIWESIWVTGNVGLEEGVTDIVKRVNDYLATVS